MFAWGIILLGSLAWLGSAYPIESNMEPQLMLREKRSPIAARTMIYIRGQPNNGGYHYERPERAFNPRAAMEAYATGGTVAAGSYYGAPFRKQSCGDCNQLVDEQPDLPQPEEEKSAPIAPEEEPKPVEEPVPQEGPAEEESTKDSRAPERKPKAEKAPKAPKTPKRRPSAEEEEEDDDEDEDTPTRKGGRNGGSVYRNFFPMMFGGGSSGAREAADGDKGRGTATAIANSFSKGRGAIASSSATAYGSPDASQYRQNQPSRYRA